MNALPAPSDLWQDADLDPLAGLVLPATAVETHGNTAGDAALPPDNGLTDDAFIRQADNPLMGAAQPLLTALAHLRRWSSHPDPDTLRTRLVAEVQRFERAARLARVEDDTVTAASRLLCTALDEAAMATGWGRDLDWSSHSVLLRCHGESEGGDAVFQQLDALVREPARHLPLLQLFQVVLALGLEGRFRLTPQGSLRLQQLRERLAQLLEAQHPPVDPALSVNWRGQPARVPRWRDGIPLWVAAALLAVFIGAVYLGMRSSLVSVADPIFRELATLTLPTSGIEAAAVIAPPPVTSPPTASSGLKERLQPELQSGRLQLDIEPNRSILRLPGDRLFEPGSAALQAEVVPLLERVGAALAVEDGTVVVGGFTDSQPIRTQQFPSNWHLSQARADAVVTLLARHLPRERLRGRGLGDTQPLADNRTAEGRARNRRIDITLLRQTEGPQP